MDRSITVGIDIRSLLEEKPSGVGQYTNSVVQALIETFPNSRFVLFANQRKSIPPALLDFQKQKNVSLVTTRIPNKLLHTFFSFFQRPRFERFVGTCDAYFFPNIIFLPTLPHPSVLTVHDLSYLRSPSFYSLRSRLWHRSVHAKKLIETADTIVGVSESTAQDVKLAFPQKEVSVVASAPPQLGAHIQDDKKEFYLMVGNIEERKNISGILQAFSRFRELHPKDLPLLLIGKRGFLRKKTKQLLFSLLQKGVVIEKGYVSEKEKSSALSQAKALIFVSFYEGFGFPGLEAEQRGIPILASHRTSLPEILGKGPLYVDPFSISELENGFEQISKMKRVAYENKILTRTWRDVAEDMMSVFYQTIDTYAHRN